MFIQAWFILIVMLSDDKILPLFLFFNFANNTLQRESKNCKYKYKQYENINRLGTTPRSRDNPPFQLQSMLKWWPTFSSTILDFSIFIQKRKNIGYLEQLLVEQFFLFFSFS